MAPLQKPKHLRLLRPFALLALATGLAGSTLGLVLLLRLQWANLGVAWPWRQVHGQLQVFGFLIPFVTGFALYLVPRIAGGQPIQRQWMARTALVAQALGVLAVTVWLRPLGALAVLVGTVAAAGALRGPIGAHAAAVGGRSRVGYLWLLEGAVWFLAAAGAADAWALWTAGPYGLLREPWAQVAYRLGIEGFAVGTALAIAARMFTGFLGLKPGHAYPAQTSAYRREPVAGVRFWAAVGAWAGSVVGSALALLLSLETLGHLSELLFTLGVSHFALMLGLARSDSTRAIDRSQDPVFPLGARASFSMLLVSALIGAGAALAALAGQEVHPIWADARRHALTLGFLLGLIATMSGRLAPGFAGRKLWMPGLRAAAVVLFTTGGLLRTLEGAAAQWELPSLFRVSALSGLLALAGFLALVLSLVGTLLTARTAH